MAAVYNPQAIARKSVVEHLVALEEALNKTLREAKELGLNAELISYQHPVGKVPHVHVHIEPHD